MMNKKFLLIKKMKKRINKQKNNIYNKKVRVFEKIKAEKYGCESDEIQEFLNNDEKICYNCLVNKWINENYKKAEIISKYIKILNKTDVLYTKLDELLWQRKKNRNL